LPFIRAKVTKARFAALSINSIHMNMTIAFASDYDADSTNREKNRREVEVVGDIHLPALEILIGLIGLGELIKCVLTAINHISASFQGL